MVRTLKSAALMGLSVIPVSVEVDVAAGLPGLAIVGLPDKSVDESRERVRSAVRAAGATVPAKRATVNLGPADVRKEGPAFDLPIAVGLLAADGQLPEIPGDLMMVGELALDGSLRPVRGVLAIAGRAAAAGVSGIIVPAENAGEAALVPELAVYGAPTLAAVIDHLKGERLLRRTPTGSARPDPTPAAVDFADVRGQAPAKRSLEIAAAGGHNVLLTGPPGTGKTLLARAMAGILPPLHYAEMLEVTAIYSIAGLLPAGQPLVTERPFRSPHHSISQAGLIGGGSWPRPGEMTLAHRGVLFLDELPQFPPAVLESIRGPLEDRLVRISRAQQTLEFPTDAMVVASQNPCPCGFADDPVRECTCSPVAVSRYRQRVSGPIRDRFDLIVDVPRIDYGTFRGEGGETSADVQARVTRARLCQRQRFGSAVRTNAGMKLPEIDRYCAVTQPAERLLAQAVDRWQLSVRGCHRVLKVARTIADLAGETAITEANLAEALSYRENPAAIA